MNKFPKVSILVAVYKAELYIERCCVSIFSQTYDNIEYIFVDDCSPDNSIIKLQDILEVYPHRKEQVKIIRNEHNKGLASVRNTQIANASGDYLLFVDSDDWIDSITVEELVNKAIVENADIVCYDLLYEFKDSTRYFSFNNRTKEQLLKDVSSGLMKSYIVLFFTKRTIYTSNQLIFNPDIRICEDFIMFYKILYYTEHIVYLPKAFYHYFQGNPNSNTVLTIQNITDRIEGIKEVERYMQSVGLYSIIKDDLRKRKFETKKEFIVDSRFRNFNQWRSIFPDSNFSWRISNIGTRNKLACLFVFLHLDKIAKLFLK